MPRRRRVGLPVTAVLALLMTGCAGTNSSSTAACAAPELTWAADTAAAGETVALRGVYMQSGCDDGTGEAEVPLEITAATLLADGEPAGSPAIDGTLTASDEGTLDMQVALPPDLAEGTRVTVELTVIEGPPVLSDELTIGR